MAHVIPFQAIRPAREFADRIAALPYDVYNRKEAKEVVMKNPLSFLKIDRAETQFDDCVNTYDDIVYERARDTYLSMKAEGKFIKDDACGYYLYELTMDGRSQTGIVGCASIDDYVSGTIKKHENTRADKEEDRIRHVDTMSAQTGPIFLAYHARPDLSDRIVKVKQTDAVNDFISEDGIRHRVWTVFDQDDVEFIRQTFAKMDAIYIADGHHRCASAVRVGQKRRKEHPGYSKKEDFNYFLSVLFADEELMIMDYNRVVKDLSGHSVEETLAFLKTVGELTEQDGAFRPKQKGQCGVYLADQWYSLTFFDRYLSDDPVKGLDVSILQEQVLTPFFEITDPRADQRIDFIGGIRGLQELERRVHTDAAIAFSMYPTQIRELFAVADAGKLMPPKSTWFEPKLRSGLFIHEI